MSLKGQSAIEYLTTYGWMLLVVALIGVSIFAIISGQESSKEVSGFADDDLRVTEFGSTTDGNLSLSFRNWNPDSASIKYVNITAEGKTTKISGTGNIERIEKDSVRLCSSSGNITASEAQIEVVYEENDITRSAKGELKGNINIKECTSQNNQNNNQGSAIFNVSVSSNNTGVEAGNKLWMNVKVENTGSAQATKGVTVNISGLDYEETDSTTLGAKETEKINFTHDTNTDENDTYTANISTPDDFITRSIEVSEDTTNEPASNPPTANASYNLISSGTNEITVTDERHSPDIPDYAADVSYVTDSFEDGDMNEWNTFEPPNTGGEILGNTTTNSSPALTGEYLFRVTGNGSTSPYESGSLFASRQYSFDSNDEVKQKKLGFKMVKNNNDEVASSVGNTFTNVTQPPGDILSFTVSNTGVGNNDIIRLFINTNQGSYTSSQLLNKDITGQWLYSVLTVRDDGFIRAQLYNATTQPGQEDQLLGQIDAHVNETNVMNETTDLTVGGFSTAHVSSSDTPTQVYFDDVTYGNDPGASINQLPGTYTLDNGPVDSIQQIETKTNTGSDTVLSSDSFSRSGDEIDIFLTPETRSYTNPSDEISTDYNYSSSYWDVEFNASNSTAGDGSITDYRWDINNSNNYEYNNLTVTHTYDSPGTYEVELNVTNSNSLSDTDNLSINLE
jgi:hypothetical protein